MTFATTLFSGDLQAIGHALKERPALANELIPLPDNDALAHPLHRICDGVFAGMFSEDVALQIAKLLLRFGAEINYPVKEGNDSALTAACSLRCDQLALFFLDQGARIDHPGCHGGTALHWAAWCGRDVVVTRLLDAGASVNQLCHDFKSTPLFWGVHGYRFGGPQNRHHQIACVSQLLKHGGDPRIPNFEGYTPRAILSDQDEELRAVLENH